MSLIVLRLRRRLLPDRKRFYASYNAARLACGTGYEAPDVTGIVAQKTARFLKNSDTLDTDLGSLRVCYALAGLRRNASVLDFGGACGLHRVTASKLMGADSIRKWAVVETTAMVAAASKFASESLRFFPSIDAAAAWLGSVDIVFVSGALQFPENPRLVLRNLLAIPAPRIAIARTPMSDFPNGKDRVYVQQSRLQENGAGPAIEGFADREVRYPSWIFDRPTFEKQLVQSHRITARIDEGCGSFGYLAERHPH